jgi:hypothetical protein
MSRNKTFDKHHTIINGMLETSGFGWDRNKNKISVVSDSVWEAYVAVNFSFFLFFCYYTIINGMRMVFYFLCKLMHCISESESALATWSNLKFACVAYVACNLFKLMHCLCSLQLQ